MRRDIDITRDLLQYAVDNQWAGQTNTRCHCHPEMRACCAECGVLEDEGIHKPDCKLMALISEARAYLYAENELIESKTDYDFEELIDVP